MPNRTVFFISDGTGITAETFGNAILAQFCLLYTSDAADERSSVDLGGRRIIKKKKKHEHHAASTEATTRRQSTQYKTQQKTERRQEQ